MNGQKSWRMMVNAALLLLAIAAPWLVRSNYLFHLLIMSAIWGTLAVSLNLVLGYTGLVSVAHGALFGIGAYTSTLLVVKAHWNFWLAFPAALLMAAVVGLLLGLLTLRLRGHYFAISTLSFGVVINLIIEKWDWLTEGPRGISRIPPPNAIDLPGLVHISFQSNLAKYYLAVVLLVLSLFIVHRLIQSPIGRAWDAIRQNELVASGFGVDPVYYKLLSFCISAAMAGASGVLYAIYITYLNPADAGIANGFYATMYLVIGGMGSLWGPVVGTLFLVAMPEWLRVFDEYRLFILGIFLILTITFLPRGIVGGVNSAWRRYAFRTRPTEPQTSRSSG